LVPETAADGAYADESLQAQGMGDAVFY